jgi:hypothetical protein
MAQPAFLNSAEANNLSDPFAMVTEAQRAGCPVKHRNFLKGIDLNVEYLKAMRDREDLEAVEKSVKRLTILAFVLGVLHVLGQIFLAQR